MVTLDPSDLTLKVGATRGGENTSTVTVAWCLSKRLSDYLQEINARDPHILLFVSNGRDGYYQAQQFQVVPLDTGLTYIGLRHAGSNIIQATVVWRMKGCGKPSQVLEKVGEVFSWDRPRVHELQMRRDKLQGHLERVVSGGKAEQKLDEMLASLNDQIEDAYNEPRQTMLSDEIDGVHRVAITTQVEIEVPKEMFAPEPGRIQRWLANFASPRRKIDQCHSRKYALYGLAKLGGVILASPLIAACWIVVKLISLLLILWYMLRGSRNIGYRALLSWGFESPGVVWKHIGPSIWLFKKAPSSIEGDRTTNHSYTFKPRHPIFLIINPFTLVVVGLVAWALVAMNDVWAYTMAGSAALAAIAVFGLLWWRANLDRTEVEARHTAKEHARLAAELATVTCETPQVSGIVTGELKPKHQTVRLVFLETKSRVCRPFSE